MSDAPESDPIEMRWVIDHLSAPQHRRLQYRCRKGELPSGSPVWSEWKNVPIMGPLEPPA